MQFAHEELVRQACANLIAQYAYLNDERRFEELVEFFTEDAVLYRPSASDHGIRGRQAILEAFRKRPEDTMTFHVTSDVLIEVDSAGTARGRSRILLFSKSRSREGGMSASDINPVVPGVFRDSFELTERGWKFSERRGTFWI